MSSKDAWLFPVVGGLFEFTRWFFKFLFLQVGSLALGGLYLIIIYVGDYWVNTLLRVYFSVAGVGSVWKVRPFWTIDSVGANG